MIVDHIKDNKERYADNIEGGFDDYIQNMKNNGEWGGRVKLVGFSKYDWYKNWALDRYQR